MAHPQKGDLLSGRYQIEDLLGEGAMGRVYRAVDRQSGDHVAVKVLKSGGDPDPSRVRRFDREAKTLRRLAHPDILNYIDHGRDGGTDYLVVELLRGRPLSELKSDFHGDADRVLMLGRRLAEAFASAHKAGVIHRDIKPGNIQITERGEPRILDYGLARWVAPDDDTSLAMSTVEGLTRTNAIMGTVPYMAPEQLRGDPVDRRSDIFSLAVVLYELAGGRKPYEGSTIEELYTSIEANHAPQLGELFPQLGGPSGTALDTVLRKALHPLAHLRFPTMDELAEALRKALDLNATIPRDASTAILLPPPSTFAGRHPATLRNRNEELDRLVQALDDAQAGQGSTLVLTGPAGIGKSLVLNEFVRIAHQRGCLCLPAEAPLGDGTTEHPVAVWLRRGAEVFPGNIEVSEALALFDGSRSTATSPGTAGRTQSRGQRVLAALSSLATRMPVVLVLDRAHAARPDLLRLLLRLSRAADGLGFVLVLASRTDAVVPEESLTLLEQLLETPGLVTIEVGPLEHDQLREMIEEAYPGLVLNDDLAARVAERAGGNPSFVRSIFRLLEERLSLRREGVDWVLDPDVEPPSAPEAEALVESRISDLEGGDVDLLTAAAVLGEHFPVQRLASVIDSETGALLPRLLRLDRLRHLILREEAGFRFDQPLTRELLLQRAPGDRKTALHARAADALLRERGAGEDPRLTRGIAHHLVCAGREQEALPYLLQAGRLLKQASAIDEAIAMFASARQVLEKQVESDDRKDSQRRLAEVELALGECLQAVAQHKRALEHLEAARGLSIEADERSVQARSLILLSQTYLARGDLLQAQRRAHDAVKVSSRSDLSVEQAMALSAEATAVSRAGDFPDAEKLWSRATEILDAEGRSSEAVEIHFRQGNHHFRLDNYEKAEAHYAKAARLVDKEADPREYARIENSRAAVIMARGDPAGALPIFEEVASIRRKIGLRRGESATLHNLGVCRQFLGELEQANTVFQHVMQLRSGLGDLAGHSSSQRNRAGVLLDLGRIEESLGEVTAATAAKRDLEDLGYLPHCLNLVGEIELTLGHAKRARNAYNEILRDFPAVDREALKALSGMGRAEWLLGNLDAAAERFTALEERLHDSPEVLPDDYFAQYWLLLFREQSDAGADELETSCERILHPGKGMILPMSRLSECLARSVVFRKQMQGDAVRDALKEALEITQRLGMPEWSWRVRRDLAAQEPAGSPGYIGHLRGARMVVRKQSVGFSDAALRNAYVAHPEREALLALCKTLPEDSSDEQTQIA